MEDIWFPTWERKEYNNESEIEFTLKIPCLIKCVGIMIAAYPELIVHLMTKGMFVDVRLNDKLVYQIPDKMFGVKRYSNILEKDFTLPVTAKQNDIFKIKINEIKGNEIKGSKITVALSCYKRK